MRFRFWKRGRHEFREEDNTDWVRSLAWADEPVPPQRPSEDEPTEEWKWPPQSILRRILDGLRGLPDGPVELEARLRDAMASMPVPEETPPPKWRRPPRELLERVLEGLRDLPVEQVPPMECWPMAHDWANYLRQVARDTGTHTSMEHTAAWVRPKL